MARRPATGNLSGNTLSYKFEVVGAPPPDLRDFYHSFLRMSWPSAIGVIVAAFLLLNAVFAGIYMGTGGVANMPAGSFAQAFFFSVQTMATIGYGYMYPQSELANVVVVVESVVGIMITALATGLIFVRFSRVRGRVVFSEKVAIGPLDGVPTLAIRVGNARSNRIYDADLRVTLSRTTKTAEGVTIYRTEDLKLTRERAPTLMQSWNIMHRIDEASPLYGMTPEQLQAMDAEITVAVTGVDDTSLQPVHGRYTWESPNIVWGARLADVLSETPEGNLRLDLSNFHNIVPTQPTAKFPYPATPAAPSSTD